MKAVYCHCGWAYHRDATDTVIVNECPDCGKALSFVEGEDAKELRDFFAMQQLPAPNWLPPAPPVEEGESEA